MTSKNRKKANIPRLTKPNQFISIDDYLNKFFDESDRELQKSESFFKMYFKWLEDEREKRIEILIDSLNSVANKEIEGVYHRIVDLRYVNDPLCVYGSELNVGGRFNIGNNVAHYKSFPALYIADTDDTAYCEKFHQPRTALKGNLNGSKMTLRKDFACFEIKINLSNCIDISSKESLRPFCEAVSEIKPTKEILEMGKQIGINKLKTVQTAGEVSRTILSPEYLKIPTMLDMPANSQWFGLYCLRAGIQGIIYPSVRSTNNVGRNIAVLIENFKDSEAFVKINDDIPVVNSDRRIINKSNFNFFKFPFQSTSVH